MLEQYPKDVRIVTKEFPLPMHKYARKAAAAALAAGEQGKYWEYHDKLLENYNRLSDQKFIDIAREIGLDVEAFRKSMADPRHQRTITRDIQEGRRAGVTGTPTVFIQGRRLQNRSLPGFRELIEAVLRKEAKAK